MTKKLHNEVLKSVTFVSGVVGLANIDLTKSATALPKDKWEDSILFEETNKGNKISLAIIVDGDVRTKAITFEITSSIKDIMKKNKLKLDKVLVYIRGIK